MGDNELVELIEEYRPRLEVVARLGMPVSIKGKVDASDLVQDAILKALESRGQLVASDHDQVRSWLRKILAHTITDCQRQFSAAKRNVSRELDLIDRLEKTDAGLAALLIADNTSPSRAASRGEETELLAKALDSLPEEMRYAITQRHLFKRKLQDIADETDSTTSAVAGLLRRGSEKLRKILKNEL